MGNEGDSENERRRERERAEIILMLLTVAEAPHEFFDLVQSCETHHDAIAAVESGYAVSSDVARAALSTSFRYVTREQVRRLKAELAELEKHLLPE